MKDDQSPSQTLLETKALYARENKLTTRWGYERHCLSTPEGCKVAQLLITPFAGYLRRDYEPPPNLPKRLRFLQNIDSDMLALMALAPVLNRQAHDARDRSGPLKVTHPTPAADALPASLRRSETLSRCYYRLNEARIVGRSPRAINPLRHRPALQHVVAGRP
jgi:hypothetical protein